PRRKLLPPNDPPAGTSPTAADRPTRVRPPRTPGPSPRPLPPRPPWPRLRRAPARSPMRRAPSRALRSLQPLQPLQHVRPLHALRSLQSLQSAWPLGPGETASEPDLLALPRVPFPATVPRRVPPRCDCFLSSAKLMTYFSASATPSGITHHLSVTAL